MWRFKVNTLLRIKNIFIYNVSYYHDIYTILNIINNKLIAKSIRINRTLDYSSTLN